MYACMLSVKLSEEITTMQTGTVENKIRNKTRKGTSETGLFASIVLMSIPFVWAFLSFGHSAVH